MKKQISYFLIAALIILQIYSLAMINSLQRRIDNNNNTIYSVENQLSNQINAIYQNVDVQLKAQASLINSSAIALGKLDVDTLTVPITFTVEPKTVTETMLVSLDINGDIVELEKSGLQYSATKNFEISDSIDFKIIIDDNGVKHIEEQNGLNSHQIKEQIFPQLFASFGGESSYGSNEYRAKGTINIDYKASTANNQFVDIKYVTKVDDKIIKETPISLDRNYGFTLDIDEKYSLNNGQILTFYIIATDSLGFVHEYLIKHYEAGANAQREPYHEQENITAPNGEIVYLFKE
jgi:hypothetical protein